jgi:hypothetical protein
MIMITGMITDRTYRADVQPHRRPPCPSPHNTGPVPCPLLLPPTPHEPPLAHCVLAPYPGPRRPASEHAPGRCILPHAPSACRRLPRGRPARPGAASRRIQLPAHDRPRGRSRPTVSSSPDAAAIWQGRGRFRPFDGSIRPCLQSL